MQFNSFEYFAFLPLIYVVYAFAGERLRWMVLLGASLLFYAFLRVPYLLGVLLAVAGATYAFGTLLERPGSLKSRKAVLGLGIGVNILALVVMKYLPFISENLGAVFPAALGGHRINPAGAFVSIGVSYYVFQAVACLVDIYRGTARLERHFGYFALYLGFFPKLLQGPIERAGNLLPQLKAPYTFDYENVRAGIVLCAWGLFKKAVIADRLGQYVNPVYGAVGDFTALPLAMATYLYAFQIYFDFSGYTDMALGSARIFNIRLTQNFNSPYLAHSVSDFWRRWHISLSSWFRDYVYIPLGGNRVGTVRLCLNLLATFLLCGLWHGAAWGFIVWGALHGLYLVCGVFYRPVRARMFGGPGAGGSRWLRAGQVVVLFNLVCFSWILFRASTMGDASYIVSQIFADPRSTFAGLGGGYAASRDVLLAKGPVELLALAASLAVMALAGFVLSQSGNPGIGEYAAGKKWGFRWIFYAVLVVSILVFGVFRNTAFIYNQF